MGEQPGAEGHIVPFDDLDHTEHAHEFVGGEHGDVPYWRPAVRYGVARRRRPGVGLSPEGLTLVSLRR